MTNLPPIKATLETVNEQFTDEGIENQYPVGI